MGMMEIHLKSISDIQNLIPGWKATHPLAAVIDFTQFEEHSSEGVRISGDFYTVMFKNYCPSQVRYGRQVCDFQDGNLVCIAPKQSIVLEGNSVDVEDKMGWGLFFHPDLIRGTSLDMKMKEYSFFNYDTAEALHLSDKEKQTLLDCLMKIRDELSENIDQHSQTLIVSNIELFLNYCMRYYGRQFLTRKKENRGVVEQIDQILRNQFEKETGELEIMTVGELAERVHLSANYMSDLLKKETGMNAQDHIHYHLIERAKTLLIATQKPVNQIAFDLGFEYPQYFSRLFRKKTGQSPVEFRQVSES
jgi:AraC-like DNA-binding protein